MTEPTVDGDLADPPAGLAVPVDAPVAAPSGTVATVCIVLAGRGEAKVTAARVEAVTVLVIDEESWLGREDFAVEVGDGLLAVTRDDIGRGVAVWVQPPALVSQSAGVLGVDQGVRDAATWGGDGQAVRLWLWAIWGGVSNLSNFG